MTLREIGWISEAREARETVADWQTARIVAMVEAVNSKKHKYDPLKFMARGAELRRRRSEAAAERRVMDGDEALRRLRAMGMIVDRRTKPGVSGNVGV